LIQAPETSSAKGDPTQRSRGVVIAGRVTVDWDGMGCSDNREKERYALPGAESSAVTHTPSSSKTLLQWMRDGRWGNVSSGHVALLKGVR